MITGPSSTLVNIAENAEIRLIELLSTNAASSSFLADCESCIANAQASHLIRTIMADEGALSSLWNVEVASDGVSGFALLVALLDRVKEEDNSSGRNEESNLAMDLASTIAQKAKNPKISSDTAKRIVGMLCFLYNLRPNGTEKCRILAQIVSVSAISCPDILADEENGELGALLEPDNISRIMDTWNVNVKEKRILLNALGKAMEVKKEQLKKQKFWLLLLKTYDVGKVEQDKEALEVVKNAAIGAIQDPITLFVEQRGMLHLPAVTALKQTSDKSLGLLYNLLTIFLTGKLQDFFSFTKQNPTILENFDISVENATKNIRILSLCSLAAEHNEIPYDVIASTLEIDPSEVESWVITAVASGLLVAKMDQLQQVVMVEKCIVRQFGMEQWKVLQERLNGWKKNVRVVLDGLKQNKLKDIST